MATQAIIPNNVKGRAIELINRVYTNDPANSALVLVTFSVGDTAANIQDFDTLSALLAGASTESAFTNYARVVLDDGDISNFTVDDTGNVTEWDLPDQSPLVADAGGASNEDVDQVALCYDPDSTGGDDTTVLPLIVWNDDAAAALQTTNGSDLDLDAPSPTLTGAQGS